MTTTTYEWHIDSRAIASMDDPEELIVAVKTKFPDIAPALFSVVASVQVLDHLQTVIRDMRLNTAVQLYVLRDDTTPSAFQLYVVGFSVMTDDATQRRTYLLPFGVVATPAGPATFNVLQSDRASIFFDVLLKFTELHDVEDDKVIVLLPAQHLPHVFMLVLPQQQEALNLSKQSPEQRRALWRAQAEKIMGTQLPISVGTNIDKANESNFHESLKIGAAHAAVIAATESPVKLKFGEYEFTMLEAETAELHTCTAIAGRHECTVQDAAGKYIQVSAHGSGVQYFTLTLGAGTSAKAQLFTMTGTFVIYGTAVEGGGSVLQKLYLEQNVGVEAEVEGKKSQQKVPIYGTEHRDVIIRMLLYIEAYVQLRAQRFDRTLRVYVCAAEPFAAPAFLRQVTEAMPPGHVCYEPVSSRFVDDKEDVDNASLAAALSGLRALEVAKAEMSGALKRMETQKAAMLAQVGAAAAAEAQKVAGATAEKVAEAVKAETEKVKETTVVVAEAAKV